MTQSFLWHCLVLEILCNYDCIFQYFWHFLVTFSVPVYIPSWVHSSLLIAPWPTSKWTHSNILSDGGKFWVISYLSDDVLTRSGLVFCAVVYSCWASCCWSVTTSQSWRGMSVSRKISRPWWICSRRAAATSSLKLSTSSRLWSYSLCRIFILLWLQIFAVYSSITQFCLHR